MTLEEFEGRLQKAMAEVATLNATGIDIHGRKYTTVAKRVEVFRKHFGCFARVKILQQESTDEKVVRMHAAVQLREESGWMEHAEGRAEEYRDSSQVNRTSAIENCETSAMGRALAAFGLHGGEYASANEVENAVHQQHQPKGTAPDAVVTGGLPLRPLGDFGYGKKYFSTPWSVMMTSNLEWFRDAERTPPNIREKILAELAWREHEAAQLEAVRAQQADDDARASQDTDVPM